MGDKVKCPQCGQDAWSTDQWDRQYRCYSHGEYTFLAPWYLERSSAPGFDPYRPWATCGDHDRRQAPEYQEMLRKAKDPDPQ